MHDLFFIRTPTENTTNYMLIAFWFKNVDNDFILTRWALKWGDFEDSN